MNNEFGGVIASLDLSRLGLSLFVLVAGYLFSRVFRSFLGRLTKLFPEWKLKIEQLGTVINFGLIIGAISLAVFLLFRSKEAAVAIGGSIGLAFAIGAKDIAASVLSGLVVVFDRSFQVGDRVRFSEIYGDVISIGVRSTRIRTLDDSVVTIPNSQFMNSPVTSVNGGALDMQVEIDFFVDYGSNLALVRKILNEAAVTSRYVFLEKPVVVLFKDTFVNMVYCTRARVKAYVVETIYEKPFESDVTVRVQRAFRSHHIQCPGFGYRDRQPAPVVSPQSEVIC